MKYRIRTIARFDKQVKTLAKKYPSIKDDLVQVSEQIAVNPNCGTLIAHDVYKIRMSIKSKGRGKSGGARIIYFAQIAEREEVYLLRIYDKSEIATISDEEIRVALDDIP